MPATPPSSCGRPSSIAGQKKPGTAIDAVTTAARSPLRCVRTLRLFRSNVLTLTGSAHLVRDGASKGRYQQEKVLVRH
jgi:hypothetical protein